MPDPYNLKRYGLRLLQSVALLIAVIGAVIAPIGLAFMTCMGIERDLSAPTRLWGSDYCSETVGVFLVITTAELFYLAVLTEVHWIPRLVGFFCLGVMGVIVLTYLVGIVTTGG